MEFPAAVGDTSGLRFRARARARARDVIQVI